MSLPVQPLLSLVKNNSNGLKLLLKNYIDFTVDNQFDQLKNSIVQMIESGQIDLNASTQANTTHVDSSDEEEDNVVDSESYQIDTQYIETEVNVSASVQPSPSHRQTASIAPSTMNNSNERLSTDQITCTPAPSDHHITTEPVIKQECNDTSSSSTIPINVYCNDAPNEIDKDHLHHEDKEKDCDCKDCLSEIKQEVEDRADAERFVATQSNIGNGQLYNPSRNILIASNKNKTIQVDTQIGLGEDEIEDQSSASLENDLNRNVIGQSNQSTRNANDLSLSINESKQQIGNVSKSIKQIANQQQSTQSVQSVNENSHLAIPSTSGLRTSDRKRIPKKMFGDDDQSNVQVKSDKRKSTQLSEAVKKVKPQNVVVIEIDEEEVEEQTVAIDKIVTLELDCTEPDCKLTLKSLELWKEHLAYHGQLAYMRLYDSARPNQNFHTKYPCTECEVVCKSKSVLAHHWKQYHQEGKFKCSLCAFVANLKCKVVAHQRRVHFKKKFQCTYEGCFRAFGNSYDLEHHVQGHCAERPYKCPSGNCEQTFELRSQVMQHVRLQHLNLSRTVQ